MYPVLFTVPGLGWEVQAYGLFMGLALLVGWIVTLRLARADKLPVDRIGTIYVVSAVVAVLCGRALWLFEQPTAFDPGRIVSLQAGGSSIVGGVLSGLLVSAIACGRGGIPWFATMDCAAPAFAIGVFLERVGAFLAGADFGGWVGPREAGYSMHVVYPSGSPVYRAHRQLLDAMRLPEGTSAPVHPSQLYAAALAVLALGLALWMRRRRRFSGQVFFAVLSFYVVARFLIEDPLRYDASSVTMGPFRLAQLGAVILLLVLFVAYRTRVTRAAEAEDGLVHWRGGPWSETREGATADAAGEGRG